MARSQMQMVAEWEKEKEEKAAQNFQLAQKYVDDQRARLQGLEQYRLEYFRKIQQRGTEEGFEARSLNQHLGFVTKLDRACEQQRQIIHNAVLAADQRKESWLKQKQKSRAVEMLLDKQRLKAEQIAAKQEQALMDEVALQRFMRNRKAL